MRFEGFSKEARDFMARLPSRDPAWFKDNRKDYVRLIADPTKALVSDLGEALGRLAPNIQAVPKTNQSISPINNDLRFAPDKPPYKDHLLLHFWEGQKKKTSPTLHVRIAPDNVGFAVGIAPADVAAWRRLLDSDAGERLAIEVARLAKAKKADVVGQSLKRVPKPYDPDHPRADLLRHKWLQVRWPEPVPAVIGKPTFVNWCVERLEQCLPVHRVLVDAGL